MDALDQIPWKNLTHAYGSADDVPDLLRALKTASSDLRGDDSPLYQLFGNIWHQGTVYEATSYAVPFLIELAVEPDTADRVGVLSLLAEIARSKLRSVPPIRDDDPVAQGRREEDRLWERKSHDAVAAGFRRLVELTNEPSPVQTAAAHVLSQLPEHGPEAAAILRRLLGEERQTQFRVSLLFDLSATGDESQQTLAVLSEALVADAAAERHAAAYSFVRLKHGLSTATAKKAVIEAAGADDLEESLSELPWGTPGDLDPAELFSRLDESEKAQVADRLLSAIESNDTNARADTLVYLLFPPAPSDRPTPKVMAAAMTEHQRRTVRAIYTATKQGRRVFSGHLPAYGLPDSLRGLRELADGKAPTPINENLPRLAGVENPARALTPRQLSVGQNIISRHFGRGRVVKLEPKGDFTELTIDFDEEGVKQLWLPTDGSS